MPRAAFLFLSVAVLPQLRAQIVREDIPYVTPPGDLQKLDFFAPARKSYATVVHVYGGGWRTGSGKSSRPIADMLVAQGYGCALVTHRLAPAARFPDQVGDVAAAVAWVKRHVAELGGDPARVFLSGHSSGAHLALLVTTDPRYLARHGLSPRDLVGVIGMSPPVDLELRAGSSGFGDTLVTGRARDTFLPQEPTFKDMSPINHIDRSLPSTLLIVGARDFPMLAADARAFQQRARVAGARVEVEIVPDHDHMSVVRGLLSAADPVRKLVLGFLGQAR